VDRGLRDGLHHLKRGEPAAVEAAAFRLLLYVIAVAAAVVALVLLLRAL
jgi:hypothetical protein